MCSLQPKSAANADIMHFSPSTWDKQYECGEFTVCRGTAEFDELENDLLRAINNAKSLKNLTRIQNVYDFGQFLMRSQIVVFTKSPLYKVRRYVAISNSQKSIALKHNLDHRRLGTSEIEYCSHLSNVNRNSLIFVVRILSHDSEERRIVPYNFTEYYIEYVAEMEYY
ncbi:uncharacterized protein LOC123317973 [Coccinella septempunctata]|uniref:uncharacterized protein LOC123317973 n=1 Tax=Coccinella septempunctata TaxID=41139 RepID=UPI001D0677C5|nr:uncharacterized protein LOC123317973 [Coccinella septempunctata]